MRFALMIIAMGWLLSGCSRQDDLLGQQIAGTWTREGTSSVTINPDGSFSVISRKVDHTNYFAGTWQVRGGIFVMTTTNSGPFSGNSLNSGMDRYRILHVDDHKFVCEEEGQTVTLSR
jgi:hypothetical protein